MGKENIVFQSGHYAIKEVFSNDKRGYILYNKTLPFKEAHSHLNNLNAAKQIVFYMERRQLPHDLDTYRIGSIARVADEGDYKTKAYELWESKKEKDKERMKYFNPHKKKGMKSC